MTAFKYSDDQWAEIVALLAPLPSGKIYQKYPWARTQIEDIVIDWQRRRDPQNAKICAGLAPAVGFLRLAADYEGVKHLFPTDQKFLEQLSVLEAKARERSLPAPKGIKYRNLLLNKLMAVWMAAGGAASVSHTPPGPSIRFLIAAAGPAGVRLSLEQARNYIRSYVRLPFKAVLGVVSIEDLDDDGKAILKAHASITVDGVKTTKKSSKGR